MSDIVTENGWYRDITGNKVHLYKIEGMFGNEYPFVAFRDRIFYGCVDHKGNTVVGKVIIGPWEEPATGTIYVNVYRNSDGYLQYGVAHSNLVTADKMANDIEELMGKRIACAKINWTEGDGL